MKTMIRVAFTIVSLALTASNGLAETYHAPAQNYNQNNWMSNGD